MVLNHCAVSCKKIKFVLPYIQLKYREGVLDKLLLHLKCNGNCFEECLTRLRNSGLVNFNVLKFLINLIWQVFAMTPTFRFCLIVYLVICSINLLTLRWIQSREDDVDEALLLPGFRVCVRNEPELSFRGCHHVRAAAIFGWRLHCNLPQDRFLAELEASPDPKMEPMS